MGGSHPGRHNEEGHTKLTEDGLKDKTSEEAIKEVVSANLKVDDNQGTSAAAANANGMGGKKADGTQQTLTESIEGIAKSVKANLEAGAESLLGGDVAGARGAFGAATHGVQDFDAGSHGGATWKGYAMTALTDPIKGIIHLVDDQFLMPGEYKSGVAATGALHGRFESTVRSAGEAERLDR